MTQVHGCGVQRWITPPPPLPLNNAPSPVITPDRVGVKTLFIEPGSPWENGYVESFNGKLRDELLNGEIFYTLREAQVIIECWRREYNTVRPHSARGYRPPAPETVQWPPLAEG